MNTDYKLHWYHNLYIFGFHLIACLVASLVLFGRTMIFDAYYALLPKASLYQLCYLLLFCIMYCLTYHQSFRLYPRCLLFAAIIATPALFLLEYVAAAASQVFQQQQSLKINIIVFICQTAYYIILCLAITIGAGKRRFYSKFSKGPIIIIFLVILGLLLLYARQYTYYSGIVNYAMLADPQHLIFARNMATWEYLLLGTFVQAILFPCIFLIIKYTTRPKEVAEAAKKQKAARTAETSGTAPNPAHGMTSTTS